jgi:hypothetical protein
MHKPFFCRCILLVPLLCAPALAADDLKVVQLEQEVLELKRQLLQLTRRLETVEQRREPVRTVRGPAVTIAPDMKAPWLEIARWNGLKIGMTEPEVIQLLGPPTSVRNNGTLRTLFFTLELHAGSFLSGQVIMNGKQVAEIRRPALQ